jgi:hypothetical protein
MNGWRKDIPKLLGDISPDAVMRMKLDEQMLLVEGKESTWCSWLRTCSQTGRAGWC